MAKAELKKKIIVPAVEEVSENYVMLTLTEQEAASLLEITGRTPCPVGSNIEKIYLALRYRKELL